MTISEIGTQDDAIRFPSLDSLRAAHTELLKRFRANGRTPEMVAEVERFIQRGRATGALLDADAERWAAQSQLDYWSTQLYQPGYEPPDATLDEFDPELAPELEDALCPYMGLDAFREANEFVFFGRRRLIGELVDELKGSRFLAVLGSSGSGKSSVVRAGLIPALKRGALTGSESWTYFPPMVPGSHPLVNLARLMGPEDAEIARAEAEAESFRDNAAYLPQIVRERFEKEVVLVIDQFEEVFTLCTDEVARQRFVDNLIALCKEPAVGHRLIITMRSDFETNIARLPALQDLFEKHVIRITPLSAAELREAIEAPAARIGLKFEEGVVDALLSDTLGEPAALPLLQFTLLKLWERRERNRITWESYKKLGGGRQTLANSADQVYLRLIPEQRVTMRRILLKMVRPGEGLEVTSNRVPRAVLYQKAEANDRIDRVLERLIKERLVRVSEGDMAGDEQVEIAHEALVRNWPRLVEWLEEERVTLRQRQRLTAAAEEWQRLDRDPSALWRGVLLEEVRRYDDLNELEKEFVAAGSDAEQAERKQLEDNATKMRKRAYYLTAALALALIAVFAAINFGFEARTNAAEAKVQAAIADEAGISAIYGRATAVANANVAATNAAAAEASAQQALANRLASQSQLIIQTQSSKQTVGLLLAIQSMRIKPSGEAAQLLQNSLQNNLLANPRFILQHESPVISAAFSPDGRSAATAALDGVIRIWSTRNGNEVTVLPQVGWVNSIAFSPNGKYILITGDRGVVSIISARNGAEIAQFQHKGQVFRAIFSPDGRYVASAGEDGMAHVWWAESGEEIALLEFAAPVYALAFSQDSRYLVAGGDDKSAQVLNVERRGKIAGQTFESAVYAIAFSPDGKSVVSGMSDGSALVWDAITGQDYTYKEVKHDDAIYSIAFSPDGQYIISGGADRTARIWDPVSGAEYFRLSYDGVVYFTVFSPDGKYALAGGEDSTARVWQVETGQELTRFQHDSTVYSAAFSPDSQLVITASDDSTARIWPTVTKNELAVITHDSWVRSVAFSPDGTYVVSGSDDGTARVWNAESGEEVAQLAHGSVVRQVGFSFDGEYVVTASEDGTARVWDWKTDGGIEVARSAQGLAYTVALSPDSKYVVSGNCVQFGSNGICSEGAARVWEAATGKVISHKTYKGSVNSVAFSPDGRYVLSGGCETWETGENSFCSSGIVQVWEAVTGKEITKVITSGDVTSVAFSPNGIYAASGSKDGTVAMWVAATKDEIVQIESPAGVYALSFSPDSSLLAAGYEDGAVAVWAVTTGSMVSRLTYDGSVQTVTFSPDGKYVAAGSTDYTARVSDALTGSEIGRILHNDWVRSVAFSPDGKYVVSGSDDATARIWIWKPQDLIEAVCKRLPRNLTLEEWSSYLENRVYEPQCPQLPDPTTSAEGQ